MQNNNLKSFLIGGFITIFVVVGAAAAIYAAWRMGQPGPVAPTVPQITPHAAGPANTPACGLTFTVAPNPSFSCDSVTITPTDTNITKNSETRTLAVSFSNGTKPITYKWEASGGTLSSTSSATPTWTAPADLGKTSTTWTIKVTLTDADGKVVGGSDPCLVTLTFTFVPPLTCDSVTMVPSDPNITTSSKTRNLTVTSSGGQGTVTYSWSATGGTISPTTGANVTWTGPSTLGSSNQTWTVTATAKDANGVTATSDSCKVQLSFGTGCNASCTNDSECPNNLSCSNGRCRNNSCTSQSDCNCPPPPKLCNDTCLKTEECGGGLICAGGNCRNSACITQPSCTCLPPPPPGPTCNSTCTNSGDCPSTMGCVDGRCRNASCSSSANCVCPSVAQTHLACSSNHTCVAVTGAGSDTCSSDASCRPVAVAPPIPKSGVELPTILTIIGGIGILAIGLLAL